MATTNLVLDGDVTTDWDTTTGANHYTEIDEGTGTPSDADYIATTTINDVDEFTLSATPANTSQVTQVDVNLRGYIDDGSSTARIQVDMFHTAGTPVTGNPKYVDGTGFGGYGTTPGTATALSWTGLTLTKAQADTLQLRLTFLET